MSGWKEELTQLTTKSWFTFVISIFMGVVGAIGYTLQSGKKLTFWAWMGKVSMAICVGYGSGLWAQAHIENENSRMLMVCVCTFFSGEIVAAWMTMNRREFLNHIASFFTKKP